MAFGEDGASLYRCKVDCLHDFILVRMLDATQKKTPGGIIIPDSAEAQPVAQVVSMGPGLNNTPQGKPSDTLKPGDLIALSKYTGNKLLLDNKVHMLIKYYDVQCKLTFLDADGKEIQADIPETMFTNATNNIDTKPGKSKIIKV